MSMLYFRSSKQTTEQLSCRNSNYTISKKNGKIGVKTYIQFIDLYDDKYIHYIFKYTHKTCLYR